MSTSTSQGVVSAQPFGNPYLIPVDHIMLPTPPTPTVGMPMNAAPTPEAANPLQNPLVWLAVGVVVLMVVNQMH